MKVKTAGGKSGALLSQRITAKIPVPARWRALVHAQQETP
jgi:hypothetical protein